MKFERSTAALAVSVLALAGVIFLGWSGMRTQFQTAARNTDQRQPESTMARIQRERVLRVGYSGFRPYTIITPQAATGSGRVTGFCADMVNEIAKRQSPPWRVEWHKVTFETLRADMESGRFDVFTDAVYQTAARGASFGFTIPFAYFGVAAGLVRKGQESRFQRFDDLDREGITIAVAEGWTSTEYARQKLSKPKWKVVTVGDDPFVQLEEVRAGRADIALQDVPTILQYARAHSAEVSALWVNSPPSRVPAGFMTRQGELELLHFMDVSILALQADGTLIELDKKWGGLADLPTIVTTPGAGLKEPPN